MYLLLEHRFYAICKRSCIFIEANGKKILCTEALQGIFQKCYKYLNSTTKSQHYCKNL